MKLYYSKGACSLVVRIWINELGLQSQYEAVDLKTKKTETGADFLKINPKGAVPALLTDEQGVLTENAVILQYLADSNKASQFLPLIGNFNRYRVLEWLNYITTEIHKSFGGIFNPEISEDLKETLFKPLIKKKLIYVDSQLANKKYLFGDNFTLPDGYLYVMLTWARAKKIDFNDLTNLTRFFAEVSNRHSVQKSLKDEGLIK